MSKRPGIRVRGTCPEGHNTETTSIAGRVTHSGPCSHEGCQLPVTRRRIPKNTPEATAPATKATEDAGDAGDQYAVREVKIRRDRGRRKPDPKPDPEPVRAGVPAAGPDDTGPRDDPEPREQPGDGAGGRAERTGFRRLGRRERPEREPRGHFLTGIYPGR